MSFSRIQNHINGGWVDSKSSKAYDLINPAKGEVIGQVPVSTKVETDAAVTAAADAYWDWRSTPVVSRARYMYRLIELDENGAIDTATTAERRRALAQRVKS